MRQAACTQAIASKSYSNLSLAILFNDRGIAYQNKGDLGRAIADYSEAIQLDPN
jgi:Flp pilus assembly protein TadD